MVLFVRIFPNSPVYSIGLNIKLLSWCQKYSHLLQVTQGMFTKEQITFQKLFLDRNPLRDWVRDLYYVRSQALQPPSQSRTGSAHCEICCSYCADWPTRMHGFSVHNFQNAHARISFRKSFAFTKGKISLFRQIQIQNALLFAFQKPDLKEHCVHKG